jgi:hypothetical protein
MVPPPLISARLEAEIGCAKPAYRKYDLKLLAKPEFSYVLRVIFVRKFMYVRGKIGDAREAGLGFLPRIAGLDPALHWFRLLDIPASFAILRGSKLFTAKDGKNSQNSRRRACSKLVTKQSSSDS